MAQRLTVLALAVGSMSLMTLDTPSQPSSLCAIAATPSTADSRGDQRALTLWPAEYAMSLQHDNMEDALHDQVCTENMTRRDRQYRRLVVTLLRQRLLVPADDPLDLSAGAGLEVPLSAVTLFPGDAQDSS